MSIKNNKIVFKNDISIAKRKHIVNTDKSFDLYDGFLVGQRLSSPIMLTEQFL